jgi:2TM domain
MEVTNMVDVQDVQETSEEGRRERAIARLKKKSEFRADLLAYVLVNAFLVAIWAVTGAHFFWPVFPILGWGIGVVFHARDAYWGETFSEDQISREMQRMK